MTEYLLHCVTRMVISNCVCKASSTTLGSKILKYIHPYRFRHWNTHCKGEADNARINSTGQSPQGRSCVKTPRQCSQAQGSCHSPYFRKPSANPTPSHPESACIRNLRMVVFEAVVKPLPSSNVVPLVISRCLNMLLGRYLRLLN